MEPKRSYPSWWQSHISPRNSKWLTGNLEKINQSVKQMLKLMEEDGDSFKRPDLIAHVEEFCRMYQALAERYDDLTGALLKSFPSGLQMHGSGMSEPCSDSASPFVTPDQKLHARKFDHQVVGLDMTLSSVSGSSELSFKEGTESSTMSSSDSELESFNSSINNHPGLIVNDDDEELHLHRNTIQMKTELPGIKEKLQVTQKEDEDSTVKIGECGNYEKLLERIFEYEEELRVVNLKLQSSEEVLSELKCELKKNESLTGELQARLDSAQRDVEMREADLELEKKRVLQLQKQIAELETQVLEKRQLSELEAELDADRRQILELQERLESCIADVSVRDCEVTELKVALSHAQNNFSAEKVQLQFDISSLSEQKRLLEVRLKELELQSKSLEDEIRQFQVEKTKMKNMHETRVIVLQDEIEVLKADHAEKGDLLEASHKNLDVLRLKYDMLMAEKDVVDATVQTLIAEVNSRENLIRQLEEHLNQLSIKHVELISGSNSTNKLVDELRFRVQELETEVDRQRVLISEGAEEKREAIRQLCFSLEHYRSGYLELLHAFIGQKRLAVLAS